MGSNLLDMITEKVCPKCQKLLPIGSFHKDRSHKNGHRSHCKDCQRADLREYAKLYPEEARERARNNWYKYKEVFLTMYGGRCECCGESNPVFLTIDHINGQIGIKIKDSWIKAYKDATNNYDPKKYRILCFNCNMAVRFGRICPHQLNKEV